MFARAIFVVLVLASAAAWAASSYQVDSGATVVITEHSVCAVVTNNHASGLALFVPTGSAGEWSAFRTSPGAGVTAVACDTTPNGFTFADVTGVNPSTLTTATAITISGINTSTPVSVSGSGSPQISINGGGWVTSGTITNGQTLAVRLTSSASFSTAMSATVTVGTGTDTWSVTTRAANVCNLPWGGTIAHGASTTAYQAASVACGNSCTSETRTCTDGALSGSYGNASCSVASCHTWVNTGGCVISGSGCSPGNPGGQPCSTVGATCKSSTIGCTLGHFPGGREFKCQ